MEPDGPISRGQLVSLHCLCSLKAGSNSQTSKKPKKCNHLDNNHSSSCTRRRLIARLSKSEPRHQLIQTRREAINRSNARMLTTCKRYLRLYTTPRSRPRIDKRRDLSATGRIDSHKPASRVNS